MRLNDIQKARLLDRYQIGDAISLRDGNPNRPFIYDRKFGFFQADGVCSHIHAMADFLAFHHGLNSSLELEFSDNIDLEWLWSGAEARPGEYIEQIMSDHYLSTIPGTAYRSAQLWAEITAGWEGSLSIGEKRNFDKIRYLK